MVLGLGLQDGLGLRVAQGLAFKADPDPKVPDLNTYKP